MARRNGVQAFPCANGGGMTQGMSLRDWFAGQALPALIARYEEKGDFSDRQSQEDISMRAYQMADEMMEERDVDS